jgi:hypothetical protein
LDIIERPILLLQYNPFCFYVFYIYFFKIVEDRETPAPRPNDKVRKIKGGFPSSVYITDLGGRNKSALHALPKDKNPG